MGFEPKACTLPMVSDGLLGRALNQAHIFRSSAVYVLYTLPKNALPFPPGDFKLRLGTHAVNSELA